MLPTEERSDLRSLAPVLRVLLRLLRRSGLWRPAASIALQILSQVSAVVLALSLKVTTNAVLTDNTPRLHAGIALFAGTICVFYAGTWAAFVVRQGMSERMELAVDTELATL